MACFSMAINSIALAGSFVYVPLNANVVLQFCTVWLNDRNIGWYLAVEQKKEIGGLRRTFKLTREGPLLEASSI